MTEIADLLRELIGEIQELRAEVASLKGPLGYDMSDLHAQLLAVEDKIPATGPLGYTIDDVVDRLGITMSVNGIDDLHSELTNIVAAIEAQG